MNDFRQPCRGDTDPLCEVGLRNPERLEEFPKEDLPGWNGPAMAWNRKRAVHSILLMVIDDLDVAWPGNGPAEANTVLIVDAKGILPLAFASERFESISRRYAELIETDSGVKDGELVKGLLPKSCGDEAPRAFGIDAVVEIGRGAVLEVHLGHIIVSR